MKLTKEQKEEARKMYREWEEASNDEQEAASIVNLKEEELNQLGLDPNDPPKWLTK